MAVILLPVGVDDTALDACLAALDAATDAGTAVWLADDAQAGPRGQAVIEHWLAHTPLQAEYTRRPRSIGEVAHLQEMLAACGDADVLVLAPDARPLPGWDRQLRAAFARDPSIGTATPWCNAGEVAAWPRIGEINPGPAHCSVLAACCAALPPVHPELPAAITHGVLLRGVARRRAGGLDTRSYGAWSAALIDLSLRMAGLGWRNALCETAFVVRARESASAEGDMEALAGRWPGWAPRLAEFLMRDPLDGLRQTLQQAHARAIMPAAQGDLFVAADAQSTPE